MLKKIVSLSCLVWIVTVLVACQSNQIEGEQISHPENKVSVVVTTFPQYDFVREVAGDLVDLTLLISPGAESHSFEPSPQDIIKIQKSNLFIYGGGESDTWVEKILASLDTSDMTILTLMECVELVKEEYVEGMEVDHAHEAEEDDHAHEADKERSLDLEEMEYDEHVWTSPLNVVKIVEQINNVLQALDKENGETYQQNSQAYVKELIALDAAFNDLVVNASRHTLVFGDRFPFRYFADEYDLDYYAAFPGCSTESDASAATVAFLIDKVRSEQIPVVFHIELSNEKMADIICEETGAKKALLYSAQTISKNDFDNGMTYLDMMNVNLNTLKEALN